MELTRTEIMPGVWLNHLRADKFKTACLSLSLLSQHRRETAAMNALIPSVLRRGTARYPDLDALSARLDELYGTAVEPVVRRIGEIQAVGFYASIPEGAFLPAGEDVLRPACELLGLDPLYCANEGKLLAVVPAEKAEEALAVLRSLPEGENAARIGFVTAATPGKLTLRTPLGGRRVLQKLTGAQLPRIC